MKQGKQYKSPRPAQGKLMMQLEFTSRLPGDDSAAVDTAPQQPSAAPLVPVPSALASQSSGFAIEVVAVQARNLLQGAGVFLSVSFISEPASMEQRHFLLLDHDVGGSLVDAKFLALPPQWRTKAAEGAPDPTWNDSGRLTTAHPGIQARYCCL